MRSEHAKREGKIFSYNKPSPDGNPGSPIRCRCVSLPVFGDVAPEKPAEIPAVPKPEPVEAPKPERSKPKASSGGASIPPKPPKKTGLGDNPNKKEKKPGDNNPKPPSIKPDETKRYSESSQSDQYMIHYHQQQMKLGADDRRELLILKNKSGNVLDMALGKSRNQLTKQKGYAIVGLPPGVDASDVVTIHNHILSNASFSGMDIAAGHKANLGPIQVIAFHDGIWFRFHLEPTEKWPGDSDLARAFDEAANSKYSEMVLSGLSSNEAAFQS